MSHKPASPPTPAQLLETTNRVGTVAASTRSEVRKLLPLLDLLEEPESDAPSPIDELKELLGAVLLSQRQLHLAMEDVSNRLDALTGRRRPSPSTASAAFPTRA